MPVILLTGKVWPITDADPFDVDALPDWRPGDLCLGSRLDAGGRREASGRAAEPRRSGSVTGFLLQGRGRRNIRNWTALFPNHENAYARQERRGDAEDRVRRIAETLQGTACRKVIGGWELVLPAAEPDPRSSPASRPAS